MWVLARSEFDVREFPEAGVHRADGPLADQKSAVVFEHGGGKATERWRRPRSGFRKLIHALKSMGQAMLLERTRCAVWIGGSANRGTQFH